MSATNRGERGGRKPGRGRTKRGQSDEFWTPRDIIAELERLNGAKYAVDFAAGAGNAVAPLWIGRDGVRGGTGGWGGGPDALGWEWENVIASAGGPGWCNPPFSKPNLPDFTRKAFDSAPRLPHSLDLLVPVSPRAGWFRRVWEGDVVGGHAIHRGPLRGQAIRFDCAGYRKEVIFLGYAVGFLEGGVTTDSALGSHCIVRLKAKAVPPLFEVVPTEPTLPLDPEHGF